LGRKSHGVVPLGKGRRTFYRAGRKGQFPCDPSGNSPTFPIPAAMHGILTPRWTQPETGPASASAKEGQAASSIEVHAKSSARLPSSYLRSLLSRSLDLGNVHWCTAAAGLVCAGVQVGEAASERARITTNTRRILLGPSPYSWFARRAHSARRHPTNDSPSARLAREIRSIIRAARS
jgi:hypothetical protein